MFVDAERRRWATRASALLPARPRLDPDGVAFAWGQGGDWERTCFEGVRRVPPGCALQGPTPLRAVAAPPDEPVPTLLDALLLATRSALRSGAVLALSGGFDSALILALARELGLPLPPILSLRSPWPEYDERARVVETAGSFGLEPRFVEVSARDVLEAVDGAVFAAETCLFNLHPVGRWLLALAARRLGYHTLITGDGADQLFAGKCGESYLPIVGALVEAAGLTLAAPFCHPAVVSHGRRARDPAKTALREIGRSLSPGAPWVDRPKTAKLMPTFELSSLFDRSWAERTSARLGLPLSPADDRDQTRWATLASLDRAFGGALCAE